MDSRKVSFPVSPPYGTTHSELGRTWEYVEPGIWKSKDGEDGWDNITDKPGQYPPEPHLHVIADVEGLQVELDSKALKTDLDTEIQARIDGDADLQGQIDALEPYDDSQIKADLATETQARIDGDAALQNQIDNIDGTGYDDSQIKADLATETQARVDGDAALQGQIDNLEAYDDSQIKADLATETQARVDGDAALQTQIDNIDVAMDEPAPDGKPYSRSVAGGATEGAWTEAPALADIGRLDGRIDAIEDGITGGGGFVEAPDDGEVYARDGQAPSWVKTYDADYIDAIDVGYKNADSALQDQINALEAYDDAQIKADLAAETQARVDGDAALQGQIDNLEAYDDSQIKADLATETQARVDGDAALQTQIDNLEAYDDAQIKADLAAETQARVDGDAALQLQIDNLEAYDDSQIKADLATETQARVDGDAALQLQIDNLEAYDDAQIKADLAAETQARVDGDAALQGQIDNLEAYDDAQIKADLAAETQARVDGDAALQGQIDNLEAYDDSQIKADLATETQARVDGDAALQTQITNHDHDEYLTDAQGSIDKDGKQYARQDGAWTEVVASESGTGAGMVISDTPPTEKVTGMQWLDSTSGDVFIWDEDKWIEFPAGKDGKDGADGVGGGESLWTDNGDTSISYTAGNVGIGIGNTVTPSSQGNSLVIDTGKSDDGMTVVGSNSASIFFADAAEARAGRILYLHTTDEMSFYTNGNTKRLTLDSTGDATFSGTIVSAGGALLPNSPMPHIYREGGNLNIAGRTDGGSGQNIFFKTGESGDTRLTINSTGDATFSGNITTTGGVVNTSWLFAGEDGANLVVGAGGGGGAYNRIQIMKPDEPDCFRVHATNTNGVGTDCLKIDQQGNAVFKGNVTTTANGADCILTPNYGTEAGAAGLLLSRPAQKGNVFLMCQNGGSPVFSVGPTGSTRAGGQQLLGTRDLIETLSTLRTATQDEKTFEGLRDSISNAIGGLIEKFEAMQTASTQEISDE